MKLLAITIGRLCSSSSVESRDSLPSLPVAKKSQYSGSNQNLQRFTGGPLEPVANLFVEQPSGLSSTGAAQVYPRSVRNKILSPNLTDCY